MKIQPPIEWTTGLFLMPEHMEAQAQWVRDEIEFRQPFSRPFNWGFSELKIDAREIASGTFRILSCSGIFEGELAFSFNGSEGPLQESERPIPGFEDELNVYLTIPASVEKRYRAVEMDFPTQSSVPPDEKISVRVPILEVTFGEGGRTGKKTLPVARLKKVAGVITLAPEFAPPVLSVSVSPRLTALLWDPTPHPGRSKTDKSLSILELLTEARMSLQHWREEFGPNLSDLSRDRLETVLLLMPTVGGALAVVHHYSRILEKGALLHPEEVYRFLLGFAGTVSAFKSTVGPEALGAYDHSSLGDCFTQLHTRIHEMLKGVIRPEEDVELPKLEIVRVPPGQRWLARIRNSELAQYDAFVRLGDSRNQAKTSEIKEFVETKKKCKVYGPQALVKRAPERLDGVKLKHVPKPDLPPGISHKEHTECFQFPKDDDIWKNDILIPNPTSGDVELSVWLLDLDTIDTVELLLRRR